jgi:hypothetical protein
MKRTENAVWDMVEHSYTGSVFGLHVEIKCLFLFVVQIQFRLNPPPLRTIVKKCKIQIFFIAANNLFLYRIL